MILAERHKRVTVWIIRIQSSAVIKWTLLKAKADIFATMNERTLTLEAINNNDSI